MNIHTNTYIRVKIKLTKIKLTSTVVVRFTFLLHITMLEKLIPIKCAFGNFVSSEMQHF